LATIQIHGGVMRGSGATVIPMINAITFNIVARIPLVILLNHLLRSADAIYWSQVGGWAVGAVHMYVSYKQGKWKKMAFSRIALLHPDLDEQYIQNGPPDGGIQGTPQDRPPQEGGPPVAPAAQTV